MFQPKSVLSAINVKFDQMTKMQMAIARYIKKDPQRVLQMSISDLASASGSKSESAIVRFYKVLGFSGYHEFKVSLATEIAGKSHYHAYSDLTEKDTTHDVKEKLFNGLIKTLHENHTLIADELLEEAVNYILESKRIFFLGYGQSGNICANGKFKFMRLGFECHHSFDSHYNSIQLSDPRAGDIIICISFSGLSKDVVEQAKECKPSAKIIAFTGSSKSPLGQIADICFATHTDELNYRTDVLMARHVQLMILDMLYIAVSIKIGESAMSRMSKSRHALSYLKY